MYIYANEAGESIYYDLWVKTTKKDINLPRDFLSSWETFSCKFEIKTLPSLALINPFKEVFLSG